MKTIILHAKGEVEGGDGHFALPATIVGIQARLAVLKEDIEAIRLQLQDPDRPARYATPGEYNRWRGKSQIAMSWKRAEYAWLVDKYQAATETATALKRLRGSQLPHKNTRDEAHQRRLAILAKWQEEHQDEDFTILLLEMFKIALTVEDESPDVSPFTEHELKALRATRAYLKEKDVPFGGNP